MVAAGEGYHIHSTGLTHDERGYPAMTAEAQHALIPRLIEKIRRNAPGIIRIEEDEIEGAEAIIVSYGITTRVARAALHRAREEGRKVGELRLITLWPFPEGRIRELAQSVRGFVVPEINMGQIALEVERCAAGRARTILVPHAGGWVHDPQQIYDAIVEVMS
jgi:2-oxoglutarate ferredoxin oxidoreductase subunit alpha